MELAWTADVASILVTGILFGAGLLLTAFPVFPGQLITLGAFFLFHFWRPEVSPGLPFLITATILVGFTLLLDFALSIMGAKRYGATWRGALGALLGGLVGIFLPPPIFWIFVGPMVGAVLGELLGGRRFAEAGRAGWGTFLGMVLATAAKLAVSISLILWFVFLVAVHYYG